MGHFPATEAQRDLGLVSLFEEAAQVTQLDLVVALVGRRAEFDFLDLDDLLLRPGLGLAFLFLVLELTVIHQAANRGIGIGRDLDQVHVALLGKTERIGNLDDAQLFSVQAYQTHLGDADFTVDAYGFFSGDVDDS
ncbi:Uncharacterised protein [Bordetella pertussis]|nr:Uncharacterised protein [Bordetella pertussis]CFU78831.1 Uncharacterised protein [Bordetella pertussis]CPH59573.1 Uncharacterised protein [Bordetella pertussis]CPK48355.1 Uncharacterised protein [Bordetella pertussis]CPL46906.1 Uncharacterised protein [Bordetella pertussis]